MVKFPGDVPEDETAGYGIELKKVDQILGARSLDDNQADSVYFVRDG